MSRTKEFKRTPFTDWLDEVEGVCVDCGQKLTDEESNGNWTGVGHGCNKLKESE